MQPISGSLATTHTSSRVASSRAKRTARISAVLYASIVILAMCTPVKATTFTFNTAPFAGTNVLNTPGRQVVGGEFFISFFPANDVFSIDSSVFGVDGPVNFVNATAGNLPTGGVNVVVLQTFDNDANPLTPFGAGNAADLIASRITTPGAGFFIYFNQSLDIPRLVYSTDLSSNTADLRILARVLNLNGDAGRAAIPTFSASNFEYTSSVPEPSTFLFSALGFTAYGLLKLIRQIRG